MAIDSDKVMQLVDDLGLKAEAQSAYHKVSVGNRAVYIAKTKRVSRIDLSGFDIKHPAVKRISEDEAKELKLGKVRGQIDFSKRDDQVLEAIQTALQHMVHLAETNAAEGETTPTTTRRANKNQRGKAIRKGAERQKHAKGRESHAHA